MSRRYDDDVQKVTSLYQDRSYRPARFPTRNITTPIFLLYGDVDHLVDINSMLKELPAHATARAVSCCHMHRVDTCLTTGCAYLGAWSRAFGYDSLHEHIESHTETAPCSTRCPVGLVDRHPCHPVCYRHPQDIQDDAYSQRNCRGVRGSRYGSYHG